MNIDDMKNIGAQVDEQLKILAQSKINLSYEETEKRLRELEREEYKEKFINKKMCNLTTCRYNQTSTCTNEEKRKECVEVSEKVLCLEDREND